MLSEANNAFACDLYHQLTSGRANSNLFFSPFSIFGALMMCAEGARGTTATEMGTSLHFPTQLQRGDRKTNDVPWNLEPLHSEFSKFTLSLPEPDQENDNDLEIRLANALCTDRTCSLRDDFIELLAHFYRIGRVFHVDFVHDAEGARWLINSWAAEKTRHLIKEIIPEGLLNELTRLVIVNAIYFRGTWIEPFDRAKTQPRNFRLSDGTTREVPMMTATGLKSASYAAFNSDGSFFDTPLEVTQKPLTELLQLGAEDPTGLPEYPDANGFALLELPYAGSRFSMVLIAPFRHEALPEIEQKLSKATLDRWLDNLRRRNVNVHLPRLKFDTDYQLAGTLENLGMKLPFINPLGGGGADFRGMFDSEGPDELFYISQVLHKACVEIDEKGTEAAAATAVVMDTGAIDISTVPFAPTFRADRPFICIIRERPTNTILFMGRVMEPE